MIEKLELQNFTVFETANLKFSPGLNVFIGENGTGKTHLLKIGYLLSNAWHALIKDKNIVSDQKIELYFSEHISNIFKPNEIGSLTTLNSLGKTTIAGIFQGSIPTIKIRMPHEPEKPDVLDQIEWRFEFTRNSKDSVTLKDGIDLPDVLYSTNARYGKGVYFPSKEIISFFEGFLALYDKREVAFDETYRDLALHLSTLKLKKPPTLLKNALLDLSADVGGTLELDGGKFYLVSGSQRREITLVAEGIRKLATMLHLIENGSLEEGDTLFWDEPESNLNPKLIKDVALAIMSLCKNGIQVILGTHSLFLLRELEILKNDKRFKDLPQKFFALGKTDTSVFVQQGNTVEDINPFVMLDEELSQSDRFIQMENQQ